MELPFYVVIWAMWRSSCLQDEGSTFISQIYIIFSPAPGYELATSCSAVKCSIDWVNPATVYQVQKTESILTMECLIDH